MSKLAIICGAGSTLSDATNARVSRRPPLDRGFFSACRRLKYSEFKAIAAYMQNYYSVNVTDPEEDSLERIMAVLYSDLFNPVVPAEDAANGFRQLLRLINRRIAESTNALEPGKKSNLYRMIRYYIRTGVHPTDISVITFNYDLHIERTLFALDRSPAVKKTWRPIIKFPECYRLSDYTISHPSKNTAVFFSWGKRFRGIQVLKLHGSLNWFSLHDNPNPAPNDLIRRDVQLWVTPRQKVKVDMVFTQGKKRSYTFPVVVPPVVNKAAILHNSVRPVWGEALNALQQAAEIVVFGYSCPDSDQESANLLSRSMRTNANLKSLSVIDPSTTAFDRFAQLSGADIVHYYRSARAFLQTT